MTVPSPRLGIDPGKIPDVGDAVGVPVHHTDEEDAVGALGKRDQAWETSSTSLDLVKNDWR